MGFFGGGSSVDLASPSAIGSTTPNTGAFTTLSATPPANTTAFNSTGYSLTGTNAQTLLNLTGTWNTTGTPTAILLNVTDTASNSNSLFFDCQVGGTSRLRANKSGEVIFNASGSTETRLCQLTGIDGIAARVQSGGAFSAFHASTFWCRQGTNALVAFDSAAFYLTSAVIIRWTSSTTSATASADLILARDAANTLAQRNATNAQTFRLYNTFTSATNFERLNFRWASNEFILDAEAGSGGGTLRGIKIGSATSSLLGFYGVTPVDQPATVADPAGGGTQDAEARTAINAIIDRLQELGLIA